MNAERNKYDSSRREIEELENKFEQLQQQIQVIIKISNYSHPECENQLMKLIIYAASNNFFFNVDLDVDHIADYKGPLAMQAYALQ